MIKHTLFTLLLVVAITCCSYGQAYEHCDVKELKDTCKNYLDKPYKYDASNVILVQFKKKSQEKEIEVPMFIGETYRLIFNTYALPPGVQVDVYNKDANHDGRKALFTCSSSDTKKVYIYDTEHWHTKLYIDYTIPASHDKSADDSPDIMGCGVVVIGYK